MAVYRQLHFRQFEMKYSQEPIAYASEVSLSAAEICVESPMVLPDVLLDRG